MSGTILRRRDRTARPPRVEHYSSAVNRKLLASRAAYADVLVMFKLVRDATAPLEPRRGDYSCRSIVANHRR